MRCATQRAALVTSFLGHDARRLVRLGAYDELDLDLVTHGVEVEPHSGTNSVTASLMSFVLSIQMNACHELISRPSLHASAPPG
jgi:hypothetical protein